MIKKLTLIKINNFDKFEITDNSFNINKIENDKYANFNLVFGFNGSGKTTISKSLSLYSPNNWMSDELKTELAKGLGIENAGSEIRLNNSNNTIRTINNFPIKNIFVFNKEFVNSHVFNGVEDRKSTVNQKGAKIKSTTLKDLEKNIIEANKKIKELQDKQNNINEKLNLYLLEGQEKLRIYLDYGAKLTHKKIEEFVNVELVDLVTAEGEIEVKGNLFKNSKFEDRISENLSRLHKITLDFQVENYESILAFLSKSTGDKIATDLRERLEILKIDYEESSIGDWIKTSQKLLTLVHTSDKDFCPTCGSNIKLILEDLIGDYDRYFQISDIHFSSTLSSFKDVFRSFSSLLKEALIQIENLKMIYQIFDNQDVILNIRQLENRINNHLAFVSDFENSLVEKEANPTKSKFIKLPT